MGKNTKLLKHLRQQELLKLFVGDFYQEKQINDRWYVKHFNRNTGRWQVAVYSDQSFQNYKAYNTNSSLIQEFSSLVNDE